MGFEFVNLTPHPIRVVKKDGEELVFPPSGHALRCAETRTPVESPLDGADAFETVWGETSGLPSEQPEAGTLYLVSAAAYQSLAAHRPEWAASCWCPDTSQTGGIRDASGRIVGTRGFQRPRIK